MACKKLIHIPSVATTNGYLVVNGGVLLNDTTVISLAHTVDLNGNARSNPELGAVVSIESSDGSIYTFASRNNGNYILPPSNLPSDQNYKLEIKTSAGKQYESDFVPAKNTVPIDSVYYWVDNDGIRVNINTHDPANSTHYYRWDYTETYIIHTAYESHYKVVDHDTTALRPSSEEIYQCWVTDSSTNILLGSSAKLSKDIISSQKIVSLPSNSEKVHIKYSILVKQYALTQAAYNYYSQLKQNTENLGTIFDPQPSGQTGNIHCVTVPDELVVGYLTVGTVSEKRIFIDNKNLPQAWVATTPYDGCKLDTLLYQYYSPVSSPTSPPVITNYVDLFIYPGIMVPIDAVGVYPGGGFSALFPECADCTLRGTNKQPAFWQ